MQNKSKKLTSRLLSALLALACVLTLLPGVAVAAETMTMLKKEEGSMVLEKGAVLEDDGTYTIQLSAYATGTTTMVPQDCAGTGSIRLHGWLKFDSSSNCCYQLCPDD